MDNDFVLEYYDEEEKMRIQHHYWIKNGRFYRRVTTEKGSAGRIRRISEAEYISALEERHNA